MKKNFKNFLLLVILVLSMFVITACGTSDSEDKDVQTDDFPTKTITIMVPYDAGGGTDLGFRTLAGDLEDELGVPVIVENKPGGNGWVGWESLQKSRPDGYTIAAINGLVSGYKNPSAERKETLEDFTIIANHVYDPGTISIKPGESRFTTIEELIEYAKENEVLAGFSSVGSNSHFSILMINKMFDTTFVPVQLGGGGKVITNVMGGHIDVGFATVGEVTAPSEAEQIEVLVVFSDERSVLIPDVPTMEEGTGVSYVYGSNRGLGGPKGIDPKIVEILNSAFKKVMESNKHIEKMEKMGLGVKFMNQIEYTELLKQEELAVDEYIEDLGWGQK